MNVVTENEMTSIFVHGRCGVQQTSREMEGQNVRVSENEKNED